MDNISIKENSYRVAIIGSDDSSMSEEYKSNLFPIARKIGNLLAENNCIVYSGGDGGIGREVLIGVKEKRGVTVAFYPGNVDLLDINLINIPIYTGVGYGIRDILMLRSVEGVISIAGGAGTLNELANAYQLYRPIVVLKGSGGWSEKLENQFIDTRKKVIIESVLEPEDIVKRLIRKIKIKRMYSTHLKKNEITDGKYINQD
jgi:uncharacterized protein (TIGR00725 family)